MDEIPGRADRTPDLSDPAAVRARLGGVSMGDEVPRYADRTPPTLYPTAVRSYTGPAVVALVLYLIFWLPGLVVNLVYLSKARRERAEMGVSPPGLGFLRALLWIFGGIPLLALVVILVLAVFARSTLQPDTSNTLNIISNAL